MPFTFTEADKAVQEFLNSIRVQYRFTYVGAVNSKEWAHDLFTVSFVADKKEPMTTEYKTGTGRRVATKFNKFDRHTKASIDAHRELLGIKGTSQTTQWPLNSSHWASLYVMAPKAASVLHSLLLDTDCGADTFEDFCSNLGYDEDSRKAHDTYLACQKLGTQLRKVFTREQIEKLRELLQDY